MTDTEKTNEAPEGPSARRAFVHLLLRFLRHPPGAVIDKGRRKYIVDCHGAWRRLGRDS